MVSRSPADDRPGTLPAPLEALPAEASSLAVLLDFDGTLSPIVADPAAAGPAPAAAQAVAALAARLPLVACITGRPALQARRLLGADAIAYTGLHGAEVLAPGATTAETPAAFAADGRAVHAIVDAAQAEPGGLAGLTAEDKGPIVALHWRSAPDPPRAERRARELGERAVAAGLRCGEGRSVLELRPGLEVTKGDAVRGLLEGRPELRHVVFAGDDITDLDAFAALRRMVADGQLQSATLIAVAGSDAPAQVAADADLVVADPAELGALLGRLAAALPGGEG